MRENPASSGCFERCWKVSWFLQGVCVQLLFGENFPVDDRILARDGRNHSTRLCFVLLHRCLLCGIVNFAIVWDCWFIPMLSITAHQLLGLVIADEEFQRLLYDLCLSTALTLLKEMVFVCFPEPVKQIVLACSISDGLSHMNFQHL